MSEVTRIGTCTTLLLLLLMLLLLVLFGAFTSPPNKLEIFCENPLVHSVNVVDRSQLFAILLPQSPM